MLEDTSEQAERTVHFIFSRELQLQIQQEVQGLVSRRTGAAGLRLFHYDREELLDRRSDSWKELAAFFGFWSSTHPQETAPQPFI
jgi:hypothetical protein